MTIVLGGGILTVTILHSSIHGLFLVTHVVNEAILVRFINQGLTFSYVDTESEINPLQRNPRTHVFTIVNIVSNQVTHSDR